MAALCFLLTPPAGAEPLEVTAAVSINGLTGVHEVSQGVRDRYTLLPLPLGEVTFGTGSHSIRLEGLPPVTFGYGTSSGTTTTRLSILNATYRAGLTHGAFVGIGTTIYNQNTTYPSNAGDTYVRGSQFIPINGPEVQFSRVAGLRFEAGQNIQLAGNRLEYAAAINPRMHGVIFTAIRPTFSACQFQAGVANPVCTPPSGFADGESATQVDLTARIARRLSPHGELLLGFRYVNYTARYDGFQGQIADRNVGFAPSLGYRSRL